MPNVAVVVERAMAAERNALAEFRKSRLRLVVTAAAGSAGNAARRAVWEVEMESMVVMGDEGAKADADARVMARTSGKGLILIVVE